MKARKLKIRKPIQDGDIYYLHGNYDENYKRIIRVVGKDSYSILGAKGIKMNCFGVRNKSQLLKFMREFGYKKFD